MNGVDLVIFDCDGVLIDSESLSSEALSAALAEVGIPKNAAEVRQAFTGLSEGALAGALRGLGVSGVETVLDGWRTLLLARFSTDLSPMSGIERVVHEVKIAKCVASNSSADRLRNSLGRTSLWGDFHPYIYSADIVRRPKPAPDLIEHCLGVFGVEGNRAIVIDDSESGVRAARSAGARAIGFIDPSDPRPSRESALLDAGAEMVATGADALLAKLRPLLDDAHG